MSHHTRALCALSLFTLVTLCACGPGDIRPDSIEEVEATPAEVDRGRALLEQAYLASGGPRLEAHPTFSTTAIFDTKLAITMMNMNPFRARSDQRIRMDFATNTFDGRITFLDAPRKGRTYGSQSFEGYRQKADDKEPDFGRYARWKWGVQTYHYLLELPMRIRHAPIVRYIDEVDENGQRYDRVFATWGSEDANREHDQWIIYINKDTHLIDVAYLTIREYYMPAPGFVAGTVQYGGYKDRGDGIMLPDTVGVQLFSPKSPERYAYQLELSDYAFDEVSLDALYPDASLERYGDSKP